MTEKFTGGLCMLGAATWRFQRRRIKMIKGACAVRAWPTGESADPHRNAEAYLKLTLHMIRAMCPVASRSDRHTS